MFLHIASTKVYNLSRPGLHPVMLQALRQLLDTNPAPRARVLNKLGSETISLRMLPSLPAAAWHARHILEVRWFTVQMLGGPAAPFELRTVIPGMPHTRASLLAPQPSRPNTTKTALPCATSARP